MSDPFLIQGPAVISFSGGRTSGYMLWRILQAHGGKLPDDVLVIFANTGKEMPETLDFVQECGERWNTEIIWLEFFCDKPFLPKEEFLSTAYRVVNHATASRSGEPFEMLLKNGKFQGLPNPTARQCTVQLKLLTMIRFIKNEFGWEEWDTAIGIRADEPIRWAKIKSNPSGGRRGQFRIAPLAESGKSVAVVGEFWKSQPFDLRLPNMGGKTLHGNCDLCFLKGVDQVLSLIREKPGRALWWMRMENESEILRGNMEAKSRFRRDRPSYKEMHRMATKHGEMFPFGDEPIQDCMCVD